MDKVPISLPLYWSKEYSAISVSKILCKLDRMALPPFALADSSAALFNLVVRVFEDTLHIKFGNPTDVKCRVLECKKDRTKFTEALLFCFIVFHQIRQVIFDLNEFRNINKEVTDTHS